MANTHKPPPRRQSTPDRETWRNSETLFLLKCYDIWSATPPRGCECGSPVPAIE